MKEIVLILALFILLVMLWIYRIVRDPGNTVEWADFISSRGADGKNHGNWNSVGKGIGVFIAFYLPLLYAHSATFDPTGGALLLGTSLAYLGAVDGYGSYLRAKQGTVQTTTEPVADPVPMKTTVIETPPVGGKP